MENAILAIRNGYIEKRNRKDLSIRGIAYFGMRIYTRKIATLFNSSAVVSDETIGRKL